MRKVRRRLPQLDSNFCWANRTFRYRTECAPHSTSDRHIRQRLDNLVAPQPPCHPNRPAFPRLFVDQHQQPQRSTVVRPRADEVIAANVVGPLYTQPIVQPQPPPGFCFWAASIPHAAKCVGPDLLSPVSRLLAPLSRSAARHHHRRSTLGICLLILRSQCITT